MFLTIILACLLAVRGSPVGSITGVVNIVLTLLGGSLVPRTHPFLREGRSQLFI